jgi:hypothetical protein
VGDVRLVARRSGNGRVRLLNPGDQRPFPCASSFGDVRAQLIGERLSNNSMQRTALRAAADAERSADN